MGHHCGLSPREKQGQTHALLPQLTVMGRETVLKAVMNLTVVSVNHIQIYVNNEVYIYKGTNLPLIFL